MLEVPRFLVNLPGGGVAFKPLNLSDVKLKLNRNYLILFLVLLIIEVSIATFVKDGFVRFVLGDFLIVIMLYCLVRALFRIRVLSAALLVLAFAFLVELFQLAGLLKLLNLEQNHVAHLILGSTFQIEDLLAYTFGIIAVLFVEFRIKGHE